jgi:HSP20 family molecular chaperone IbpA
LGLINFSPPPLLETPVGKNLIDLKKKKRSKMNCRTCDSKLQEAWTYCPYCGTKRASTVNRGFERVFQVMEKSFRDIFGSNFPADFPFGKGFMVEISEDQGSPKVSVKEFDKMEERKGKPIPRHSKVLEPHILVKEGGRLLQVQLPLVKSKEDIAIKKFENSFEVKAKAGDKVYFTIIPHSKFPKLVKHEFRNGVLTLKFS